MTEAQKLACLRGYSSENYDKAILDNIPILKFDRIKTYLGITRTELFVLLAVYTRAGIQMNQLKDVIGALRFRSQVIPHLLSLSFIREEVKRGASSFQSYRKFYLTGKGKEIVRVYYELMEFKG